MKNSMLGDYNLIKQLGMGSLGTVFFAEHRFMKQKVVLKVLPEEMSSDRSFVQRFVEDVKILASLDHPNIVKIHNVSFSNGVYFLVTDCVVDSVSETTNLGQYILTKGKRLPEEELLRLIYYIAEALDYAHTSANGKPALAHRGLKLSNVFIGKGKGLPELFLSDFGLSRIVGVGPVLARTNRVLLEALSGQTTPNHLPLPIQDRYFPLIGDPSKISLLQSSFLQSFAFLAPEQKRLDRSTEVGPKADIYAFGVLIYFILTKSYPEGVFDLPSEKSPEYRLDWDSLVLSCMRQDPGKRPDKLVPLLEKLKGFIGITSLDQPLAVLSKPVVVKSAISVGQQIEERIRSDCIVTQYKPQVNNTGAIEPLLTDVVVIQEGSYQRGSTNGNRDEMPRHRINIKSFAIDIHPITNEQFIRFLEHLGSEKDDKNHDIIRLRESRIRRVGGKLIIESGYAKHPVIGVSWYGAMGYAAWIGRRLPTEVEWEIAACGDNENNIYPTGEDIEKSQANFFSSDTTSVMSYIPNNIGLYDIAGNVYEWCADWYDYNYYEYSAQEPNQPKGPLQGVYRVLRGGCWKSLKEDMRCAHRHRNNPGTINRTYGFRCASDFS